jgi:multicomponent Na+:H+ antiporter subunit D
MLPVVPVALPLFAAALVAAAGERVPRWVLRAIALVAAIGATAASIALAIASRAHPILYWLGGWTPRAGVCLGIALAIDPLGAGLAALSGLLVVAALVSATIDADAGRSHFQALTLAFLAALSGFGLTGDLFNLFVFFELMSVSAFALTGFRSRERGPIQGAFNFAVTNTIGATFLLMGIALLYGRTGALNLAQIGRALEGRGDALVLVAFTLVTCGFSVKAALVPFHFWLADAHAIAPAPVSVILSGVMVEAGLYAVLRLWGAVFQGALGPAEAKVRAVLAAMGVASALIGGVMCLTQRHMKRLLAFSTISHAGVMAIAVASADPEAVGGAAVYVLGHGFAKGALFLCAGALLRRLRSVDEIALKGRGKALPFTGVILAVAGLALAGMPPFGLAMGEAGMDAGVHRLGHGWLSAAFVTSGVLTGAAVLRAAGRVFLGLGPRAPDAPEVGGETSEAPEEPPPRRRRWVLTVPPAVLLALSLAVGLAPGLRQAANEGAARVLDGAAYAAWVLDGRAPIAAAAPATAVTAGTLLHGVLTAAGAVLLAALILFRRRVPPAVRAPAARVWGGVRALRALHGGRIGDDVAWLVVGVAAFGTLCMALR